MFDDERALVRLDISEIVELRVERLRARLAERRLGLELTEGAKEALAEAGWDPAYGARPLKRLIRQVDRKVFLIVDGHPVHRARAVKEWLAGHANELALFYLPPYSPELNPDELLNQDVKTNGLGRRRPTNRAELISDARSYLRRRQRRPALVSRYFEEPRVARRRVNVSAICLSA